MSIISEIIIQALAIESILFLFFHLCRDVVDATGIGKGERKYRQRCLAKERI